MLTAMFNKIHRLSIRYKLSLMMMLISVIVLTSSTVFIYRHEIRQIESSEVSHVQMQASLISASIESALAFNDLATVRDTLRLLKHKGGIEYVAVVLADNTLFADCDENTVLKPDQIHLNTSPLMTDEYFDVAEPVTLQGELLGHVFIRANVDKINDKRDYYQKVIFSVLLLSLVLTYVLARLLQRIITVPLATMVNHVKQISDEKNYQGRLALESQDEFSTLANGFNHMLDVVQEREHALTAHSTNLQKLVDERTKQLYHQANYDSLTKLPNRHYLMMRLEKAIAMAKQRGHQLAVLFMDIDRFKVINDSLGHNVGDQLLQEIAARLAHLEHANTREHDVVARLGGDEFVYLIEQLPSTVDAINTAGQINQVFAQPVVIGSRVLHVSTSVGISIYPEHGSDSVTLLKNADASMYFAKAKGPGNYSLYDKQMNVLSYKRLELENHLRSAIANNEFYLVYQPQVSLKGEDYRKAEALIRWHHPELGRVSPGEFIPVAEEIGYINELGKWVIATVCKQLKVWQNQGVSDLVIGINISSSHLLAPDLVEFIQAQVTTNAIGYHQLELEITEEVFLAHSGATIAQLKRLQALGIRIAIDDFGTGYSSLQYLKNLPVDTLKLDGMFIDDIEDNEATRGITCASIILAHSLKLRLVAECVESQAQLDFLRKHGCDFVQGYYLHRPLTVAQLTGIYRQESLALA
ncbi:EAL domain-containing protein [Thalassotalea euphylliae]|uniref:EAL domain-containing protein n=1 Tax=Thalassotalea euphylliae TaxID=1655234 RepID=A0A3E0TSG3_9GAMM|nr:EAL domain-containing protein [Thalassotalea euphylliae]REL27330.1 EAL domain-containing protein [Thalassotalea euphylliae]